MSYALYFDAAHKLLRVAYTGRHTDDDIRRAVGRVEAFLKDHEVEIGILDFSGVESTEVSPEFVRNLALSAPHYKKYFLVAPQNEQFGFSRLFQTFRGGESKVQVVRDLSGVYEHLAIVPSESVLFASANGEKEDSGA